ncbi:hypothetical protein CFC21_000942 [Triticum aestivum]|uniref:N-acetyltransferase domain-containing protein n=1 Tax=Triticum aestivum TaxID=4565 RepID=A0A3B5XVG7_WHEAT|nr:hypothetical protein CFC21_000942 [Triticum aestivum]
MASASPSRLLPPFPPPAAPTSRHTTLRAVPRSCSLAIPSLRCRASAPAAVDAGAPLLLEDRAGAVSIREFVTLDELHAAVRLRVRTFYEYARDTVGAEFVEDGEERIVVGSLDLNQCLWLPDELTGKRPGVTESSHTRAYLSNVCVAKELQRCGLGYALVDKSKKLARITDLYVHVAINNEAAQKLYIKSGFVYESEEPAQQARHLGRPRRLLLWLDMKNETL